MPEINKPANHAFCWIELNTSDPVAAKPFYEKLFGWNLTDMPMGNGTYTMANVNETSVCGLTQLPEEAKNMGAPPHWLAYVKVEDPRTVADQAKTLGGKVLKG